MNKYLVRFANLVTGEFHEFELTGEGLKELKREHIQVLDIMNVKTGGIKNASK